MRNEPMNFEQATEGLLPELRKWVEYNDAFGYTLRHPLVLDLFLHPDLNERLNMRYHYAKKYADECLKDGDYSGWVFIHERPFRFERYLSEIHLEVDIEEDALLLLSVWMDCESPHVNTHVFDDCFDRLRDTEVMRRELDSLKFPLTIYRGFSCNDSDCWEDFANALSWTTDKFKAEWFAKRFATGREHAVVATYQVNDPDEVYTFCDGRGESEVILAVDWERKRNYDFECV